ncbi:MAG: ankyrin repeat protein 50, partial [Chloroflexota bacterium]|nr:ankyrin repeat protein 50 [Chloroflexota bacterium]
MTEEQQPGLEARGEALVHAAREGDANAVERLLAEGVDANHLAGQGWDGSPLQAAAGAGYATIVARLLGAGADPAVADRLGTTPLHAAAYEGHAAVIRILLAHGAPIDARTSPETQSLTPLMRALSGGHGEAALALIEGGADVAATESGPSPLALAIRHAADPALVEALLSHGAPLYLPEGTGADLLRWAVEIANAGAIPVLLAHDDRIDPLSRAALEGDPGAVEALLAGGANPNQQDSHGGYPLAWAAARGHEAVVELLL